MKSPVTREPEEKFRVLVSVPPESGRYVDAALAVVRYDDIPACVWYVLAAADVVR